MSFRLRVERPPAGAAPDDLIVLLPGAHMSAEDFYTHGFIEHLRRLPGPIEIITVETGFEVYLDDRLAERLEEEVIQPALLEAPRRLWLAGISLGGFGALRYAQRAPRAVAGLLLLAPFLGSRGLIAQVEAAGGVVAWAAQRVKFETPEQHLLGWLAGADAQALLAACVLGYGRDDRYADAHRLLATLLPAESVFTAAGGHDWPTWVSLWPLLLPALTHGVAPGGAV